MGPEATITFYRELLRATPAEEDGDHIPCAIIINPQVPDRTEAILAGGPSPVPDLVKSAGELQAAGADFITVPCVTAHYFLGEVQDKVELPFLDLIQLTLEHVKKNYSRGTPIGLLATTGTIRSNLFQDALELSGYPVLTPDPGTQETLVMNAIYTTEGIKAGKHRTPRRLLYQAIQELAAKGTRAVILGCTEIPIVIRRGRYGVRVIDPLRLLAEKAVRVALEMEPLQPGG